MWETPAALASSKEQCEGWDCFTVPRFARTRHFHGPALNTILQFMYRLFVGVIIRRGYRASRQDELETLQF